MKSILLNWLWSSSVPFRHLFQGYKLGQVWLHSGFGLKSDAPPMYPSMQLMAVTLKANAEPSPVRATNWYLCQEMGNHDYCILVVPQLKISWTPSRPGWVQSILSNNSNKNKKATKTTKPTSVKILHSFVFFWLIVSIVNCLKCLDDIGVNTISQI